MAASGAEPAGWQDPRSWQELSALDESRTDQLTKPVDVCEQFAGQRRIVAAAATGRRVCDDVRA